VITTQLLSWQALRSPLTCIYEEHVLLQLVNSTITDVSRKEQLSYDIVLGVLERRINTEVNWEEIQDLEVIGIDEVARRKGHRDFLAIITTHTAAGKTRLLAVLPDRKKATVKAFFDAIPQRLRRTVRTVCTDMWEGYVNAVRESFDPDPECQVKIVIDRFHVAKSYYKAADNLRKREMKRLKQQLPEAEYRELHGVMWLFRRRKDAFTPEEQARLEKLFQYAPNLKRAYQLREQLTQIFDTLLSPAEAASKFETWCQAVRDSGLHCFNKFLTTLHNWWDEILNYFKQRYTSGFVEGFNNKVKVLKRRCYGILNVTHLFQRLYLDLEGYRLFA
jgi:transposase